MGRVLAAHTVPMSLNEVRDCRCHLDAVLSYYSLEALRLRPLRLSVPAAQRLPNTLTTCSTCITQASSQPGHATSNTTLPRPFSVQSVSKVTVGQVLSRHNATAPQQCTDSQAA